MTSGIYVIARRDSGRFYIGSAVDIRNRWATHRSRLNKQKHHSPQLQAAWNKHGSAAFEFAVLEAVEDKSRLIEREQVWIDKFNPYYNTCKTAGSVLGHVVSAAARARISAAQRGRVNGPPTAETRAKISLANRGRKLTPEHREKLSMAKLGKKRGSYSAAHRAHISAAITAWHRSSKA